MPSVFEYTDYRKFLKDFYTDRKTRNSAFSHRYIAEKVGFKSGGHFSQILSGKANISIMFIEKLAEFCKLNKREAQYFQNMVLFNQSREHTDKKRYFEKMMSFKESSVKTVSAEQYQFYDKWYYTAVREVLSFFPCDGTNARELAKVIVPPLTPAEAQQALDLLNNLHLVAPDEHGMLRPRDALITTGYEAQSLCINTHVINTLELARQSIDRFDRAERNLSWVALSVSDDGYKAIVDELRSFRKRIMDIVKNDPKPNRAYLFNFQVFPISRRYFGGRNV